MYGRVKKAYSCVLVTDDPLSPQWTYRLEADFYPPVLCEPATRHVAVESGQTQTELSIYTYARAGSSVRQVSSIESGPDLHLSPTQIPEPQVQKLADGVIRASWRVQLQLDNAALSAGPHADRVVVKCADGSKAEAIVSWVVKSPFAVEPSRLFLVARASDHRGRKTLLVRSLEGKSFRITSVNAGSDGVRCDWDDDSPAAERVELRVSATELNCEKAITGELVLHLDDDQVVRVPYAIFPQRR
jgi:hypothetical protein